MRFIKYYMNKSNHSYVLLLISKDIIYAVLYLITQVEHLGLTGVSYLRPLGYIVLIWSIN